MKHPSVPTRRHPESKAETLNPKPKPLNRKPKLLNSKPVTAVRKGPTKIRNEVCCDEARSVEGKDILGFGLLGFGEKPPQNTLLEEPLCTLSEAQGSVGFELRSRNSASCL